MAKEIEAGGVFINALVKAIRATLSVALRNLDMEESFLISAFMSL